MLKFFIFRKHSNSSSIVENQSWFYSLIFPSFSVFSIQSTVRMGWKMELRFFHMGLGAPFRDVDKLLKFCDWNWNLSSCTTVNLKIDFPILLSSHQPYWSINRQDVRLKSSPISLWSLIGAEGQEMCVFLLVYCLYGSNTRVVNVYVGKPWNNSPLASCCLFSPFQNLLFFIFFHDIPKTNSNVCYLQVTRQLETY